MCEQTCPKIERALPLFHASHEAGVSDATEAFAKIHLMGIGVGRNPKTALPFIKGATEARKVRSQRILGLMFLSGKHILESAKLAVMWLEKAEKQGEPVFMSILGVKYMLCEGVTQNETVDSVGSGYPRTTSILMRSL